MMSCANDTTRLLLASDISTDNFEMDRSDWSSVGTQAIKLCKMYNKFGVVTDCSFIKLLVGAPCICKKETKNASETNFHFGGQLITVHIYKCRFFVMTFLKSRSLKQPLSILL
jgi:hypothetical protein